MEHRDLAVGTVTAVLVRPEPLTRDPRAALVGRLVARRLAWGVPLVLVVTLGVFVLVAASPADSASAFLGGREEFVGATTREDVRTLLDAPSWGAAWWGWLTAALTGDLGLSTTLRAPVVDVLVARVPWTLLLMVTGMALAAVVAVPVAVVAALRPGGVVDRAVTACVWSVSAVPAFVVGLGLMAVFALTLRILPAGGLTDAGAGTTPGQVVSHLLLPAGAVALSQLPWITLHLRAALVDGWTSVATQAARLRGLSEARIVWRHVLPSSFVPVITLAGTRLPELVTGAILVEQIFSWPGIGQALVSAALAQDFTLLAGVTACLTLVALLGSLLADVGLVLVDPRVQADDL